jgi:hypothetical protein
MKKNTPHIALLWATCAILLSSLAACEGCAKLRPDADAFLTRSEQALAIGQDTLDAFFILEKGNSAEMEKLIPGCHATAENLRRKAPPVILSLRSALDTYRATKGAPDSKASVEVYIASLQSLVAEVKPMLAKWGEAKGGAK